MAETVSEESGVGRSEEGILSSQSSHSGEALAEWRSSEQVENGSALTSAPYWDTDDDDDGGPKPSELYGKYTWKIEKFSQITKRELRSSPFEVGGYKWYILIYPQGCDVCNHLSLFLCVANHDKLLPGWSHFAQFTIAVVNKDPKKSKYSDTLHRFWKKEHDWGWKKFMELSKIYEGFVELDTLIIKAQVQVIREKADRPFRCLDSQYRRELVRVYLTNVEQICRRFVEDRRGNLGKLIEDNARWSSFRAFWLGIDQTSRRRMSKEHTDVILKVVVKHFFIEKEVTSTLVMDSLYSGLKALEGQSKCRGRVKLLDVDEMPAPIVRVEKDTFVLVDDVLPLLERAAVEPLPPKDEKGPQNRTKDGNPGEDFNKDSIERDERRLTELGRRTVEIFVLAHIFSNKIEVAYQEAVALKRQEELIREEEAAWLAESEQKAKRGTNAKEKKTKKKQAKQKRNNRKGKDKERDERHGTAVQDKIQQENLAEDKEVFMEQPSPEKPDVLEDASDTSDVVECASEVLQADSEERDSSPVKWDIDMSEGHPPAEGSSSSEVSSLSPARNGMAEKRSPSVMDDSSSTCSTDSLPSVVTIGSYKGNSISNNNAKQGSTSRGKSHKSKAADWANQRESPPPAASAVELMESSDVPGISSRAADNESEVDATAVPSQVRRVENHQGLKEGGVAASQQQKRTSNKEQSWGEVKVLKDKAAAAGQSSSSSSPPRSSSSSSNIQQKTENKSSNASTMDSNSLKKSSTSGPPQHSEKAAAAPLTNNWSAAAAASSRPETQRGGGGGAMPTKPTAEKASPSSTSSSSQAAPPMSRPSSAPLVPAIRPPTPAVSSMVQSAPSLARSASAVGRLGPDSSSPSSTHSFVPQSYRNAIIGNSVTSSSAAYTRPTSPSTTAGAVKHSAAAYSSQPVATTLVSTSPAFLPSSSTSIERLDFGAVKPGTGFAFNRDLLSSSSGGGSQWMDGGGNDHLLQTDMRGMDYYKQQQQNLSLRDQILSVDLQQAAGTSGRQNASLLSDEFPHLDIINDLLDDEQGIGKFVRTSSFQPQLSNGGSHSHYLNRQYSFPGEVGVSGGGGDLDTSSSSTTAAASCRFERARSYRENGFQSRSYNSNNNNNSYGSSFESMREYIPQASALGYGNNGQMESLMQNQWHHHVPGGGAAAAASDLSTILGGGGGGMKNNNHHQHHHPSHHHHPNHLETDTYSPYYSSDYTTNMAASGLNGYNVFRPPPNNGH